VITTGGVLAIRFGGDESESAMTGRLALCILTPVPALATMIIPWVAR